MQKYVTEFIGTFFLVVTIGMCVIDPSAGNLAPIAIGSALMVMVYAGGHVSGGHYNPAVTLAVFLRGKCPASDVPGYGVSQVAGGVVAAVVALYLKGNPTVTTGAIKIAPALLAELVGTFAPDLRGSQRGHRQRHGGQFQLRPGHRIYRGGDGLCARRNFRRRV